MRGLRLAAATTPGDIAQSPQAGQHQSVALGLRYGVRGHFERCPLHAHGKPVPELIGRAAPRDGIERALELEGSMRLGTTDVVAIQLVLELAAAKVDDHL